MRQYKNEDCDTVAKLFYETVHSVNAKDFTAEQLSAWANNAEIIRYYIMYSGNKQIKDRQQLKKQRLTTEFF